MTLKAQSTGLSTFITAATVAAAAAAQAGIACVVVVASFIIESSHIEMSKWRGRREGGEGERRGVGLVCRARLCWLCSRLLGSETGA